jgi:hypothetical protein
MVSDFSVQKESIKQKMSIRFSTGLRSHCTCKEMPVIPVNKVVDPIRKNGGSRRRRGARGQPQNIGMELT